MLLLYKILLYLISITVETKEGIYNTMAIATSIPRYDKNQLLVIDDEQITLINYLKKVRSAKKITKKKISNLIKHNDYWYSQIERDGKNGDDKRQRSIYRPDLVNIISIVFFDASTSTELDTLQLKSENYLDKILKAVPIKNSVRKLEWYEIFQGRTEDEQNRLFDSLLATYEKRLREAFDSLQGSADRDAFLNCMKNINLSMKIDPLFILFLSGMPFADFLYDSTQANINSLLRDIMQQIDKFTIENQLNPNSEVSTYLNKLQKEIKSYTKKDFLSELNKKQVFLPPDQVSF